MYQFSHEDHVLFNTKYLGARGRKFSREDHVLFDKMASAGYEAHGDRHWVAVDRAFAKGWFCGAGYVFVLFVLAHVFS